MDVNPSGLHNLAQRAKRLHIPLVPRLLEGVIFVLFHAVVPTSVVIGEHANFVHRGLGVVIHPGARIGRDVIIAPGVVIGGRSHQQEVPVVGDSVCIGAGAKILGNVHIGDCSVIGANAVVLADVPPHSLVGGIPARILRSGIEPADYC